MMSDYFEFLKSIEYFKQMDQHQLRLIHQTCVPETYDAGQVIISEGEMKEKFYIVFDGVVKVLKNYFQHNQSLLAELTSGDMFGELSLIDDLPRSATVITSKKTKLLTIDKTEFERLFSENVQISFSIMKWMSAMIRRFNKNFVDTLQLRNTELEEINRQLEKEIEIRKEKEAQLNIYQNRLEEKVLARTRELRASNEQLKHEVAYRKQTESEKERAIFKLESTMAQIKTLSGLFPICIKCKKIRDDTGYWQRLEQYLQRHSDAEFRKSICEECSEKYYPKFYR
jgi:CRP-like cAMP-binding protein